MRLSASVASSVMPGGGGVMGVAPLVARVGVQPGGNRVDANPDASGQWRNASKGSCCCCCCWHDSVLGLGLGHTAQCNKCRCEWGA